MKPLGCICSPWRGWHLQKRIYLSYEALQVAWEKQPSEGTDPAVDWRGPMVLTGL